MIRDAQIPSSSSHIVLANCEQGASFSLLVRLFSYSLSVGFGLLPNSTVSHGNKTLELPPQGDCSVTLYCCHLSIGEDFFVLLGIPPVTVIDPLPVSSGICLCIFISLFYISEAVSACLFIFAALGTLLWWKCNTKMFKINTF